MPLLTPSAELTAQDLSKKTGLNINVVRAWVAHESAWGKSPSDTYNFLNLRSSSGGWANYGSPDEAANAYYHQLQIAPQWYGKILSSAGQPPEQQIAAIAASPWSADHYGGSGGPNLINVYNSVVNSYAGGIGTLESAGGSSSLVGSVTKTSGGGVDKFGKPTKPWGTVCPGIDLPGPLPNFDVCIPAGSILKIMGGATLLLLGMVVIFVSMGLGSRAAGLADVVPGGSVVRRRVQARRSERAFNVETQRRAERAHTLASARESAKTQGARERTLEYLE